MNESGSHRRPEQELRQQPARPEIVVAPLRPRQEPTGPSVASRIATWAWAGVAVVIVGLAVVVALEYSQVRTTLEASVATNSSGATSSEIAETVTVTLLASGAVAVLLLVLAGLGLSLARTRRVASGTLLLVAGVATIGASILFFSFMSDASEVAGGVLHWGPLAGAGVAAVATIAAAIGLSRR
ncbi:hypothetical protein [Rhodococcoides yunnanense]|uniref:hypothetical protein n=1 Tax=Rhodococcoides yunnanense TaxID=278209 RepID=UPI000932BC08|nr:hypothetical protein [Rhodococcus yunnanensis]